MDIVKRILYTACLVCMLLILFLGMISKENALASMPVKVAVDGVIINPGDQPPFIHNDRVLVPLRVITDFLGANTTWNDTNGSVRIEMENKTIEMWPNSNFVRVNGASRHVDAAPRLTSNNRIVVPLRFISELLGAQVGWDGKHFIASVFTRGQSSQERASIVMALADRSRLQQNNLKRINIGASEHQVEYIMGKPNRKEIGLMGLDTWTYHYNYHDYYLFGFYKGELMYIYTKSALEYVLGVGIGDTKDTVEKKVKTRDFAPLEYLNGNVLVYLANNHIRSNRIHTVANNNVVIFHIDELNGNRVAGIEIYHRDMIVCDNPIIDYRYTYFGSKPQLGLPQPSSRMQTEINKSLERQIFDMTNAIRVKEGLDPVLWHSDAARAAYAHSKDMSDRNYFDHMSPEGKGPGNRVKDANIAFQSVLENIAMNTINSAETLHAWMNSEGHREAILHDGITHLGVGVFSERNIYYTQVFLQLSN
ncbi:stalk domain-containing protein [Desulfitibacter alkalitolerans]|uniref:stalk domain-containing protein n=1 Tax=Desulfitibacter alkalitolerans TaxID=264641 RepID=UPI0004806D1C|nr:stalk domain-containing protein [Desulfitibacter alkalitolerans]